MQITKQLAIFLDNRPGMLARLAELGVLVELHPALKWDPAAARLLETLEAPEPDSWRGVPDLPRVPRRATLGYLLWLAGLVVSAGSFRPVGEQVWRALVAVGAAAVFSGVIAAAAQSVVDRWT